MRIVGGSLKGRRLNPSKLGKVRPTTDMAREGLFNLLSNLIDLNNLRVLDLFTGSGAVSLEFASRGAIEVVSVDMDIRNTRSLIAIIKEWELENIRVVRADVYRLIKKASGSFDLVFADPPYADRRLSELPDSVIHSGWLGEGGIFVLEHGADHSFQKHSHFESERSFGNVHFSFFRR